ncbi:MAG: hypothetical protein ACETWD_05830 [Desulfatiglandales bacterium]
MARHFRISIHRNTEKPTSGRSGWRGEGNIDWRLWRVLKGSDDLVGRWSRKTINEQ